MKIGVTHIEFGILQKSEKDKPIVILSVSEESLVYNKKNTQDPSHSFRMIFFNAILTWKINRKSL